MEDWNFKSIYTHHADFYIPQVLSFVGKVMEHLL